MKLRYYQNVDFPQLEQLLKDIGIYYEPLDKRAIIKKKIEHDPESIIVAENNGLLCGTVFIIYDPWCSFVYHLGVHPNYRNQGLGNKLMDKAEGILKKRGIQRPTIFIEEDNEKVVDFYKNRGWFVLYKVFCMEKEL